MPSAREPSRTSNSARSSAAAAAATYYRHQPLGALAPGVDLIVVYAGPEGRALVDEAIHPWRKLRVGQIPVAGFQLRAGRRRARDLAPLRIHFDEACDLVAQRLNDCRPLALSSSSLSETAGHVPHICRTASNVLGKSIRSRVCASKPYPRSEAAGRTRRAGRRAWNARLCHRASARPPAEVRALGCQYRHQCFLSILPPAGVGRCWC